MGTEKETVYRVGVMRRTPCGLDLPAFVGQASIPSHRETFVQYRHARLFDAGLMSSWVRLLASMYPCVLVERVEVVHG